MFKNERTIKSLIVHWLVLLFVVGCSALTGEEIARLPINQVSTSNDNLKIEEALLQLKTGEEIVFWSEMDMEFEGDVSLLFRIEILKNGESYGGVEIDPTDKNMTIGELKTSFMGKTDWSFTGRNKRLTIEEDGDYTFKGILLASDASSLILNKAEIVIKR